MRLVRPAAARGSARIPHRGQRCHPTASLDRMVVDGRELEVRWDRDAGSERARPAPRRSASPARTPPARAGPPSDDAVREGRSVYFGNVCAP